MRDICVPRHDRYEGTTVGAFRRQFVPASAVIAAVILFGGTQARAGYVAVPTLADHNGSNSLIHSPVSPFGEIETSTGSGDSAATTQPRPDDDVLRVPTGPVSPARKLPHAACNFGHNSGAGSSSSSAPNSGPSSPPAGDLSRPQVPPLELSSLLPPQTGDAQPFSVASFLFRPPRAA
jgi:hypothetical protein